VDPLDPLLACAGDWRGVNRLWMSPDVPADESASNLTVVPMLGGTFLRVDQTWARQGRPEAGSMLLGYDDGAATGHWVDSFHNGRRVMACTGAASGAGVDVRGNYPAPPGPDWGWRIQVIARPRELEIVMYNVDPGGMEELAVRSTYAPA
jgi:hypothetical protein